MRGENAKDFPSLYQYFGAQFDADVRVAAQLD
jgi:hypothetical protein